MVRDCVKLHGVLGGSRLANHILLYWATVLYSRTSNIGSF